MKIRLELTSRYKGTHCTFCDRSIHEADPGLPGWLSERVGKAKFWRHKHTAEHKGNRPTGAPTPAPTLDVDAFERRARERQR
ncbi:hypothetical protein [Mycolicibacterium fortuitum]|uniref:hypothetical protein n=1 Tax=Mycolicibacterium fortuitum TaxID=1766 RepID=UPI0007E9820B|nr:hypothetical protein [Mycolicibacterium fortuitum]OBF77076.1 hypothetical protein A5751_23135 [Mycolicibacterium fortuitum]